MQYRNLGRTGLKVSALSFGCMRLPKIPDKENIVDQEASLKLFRRANELGINYFDSAYLYDNGDSERVIGRFLKEVGREKIIVQTKNPVSHDWWPIPNDKPTKELWWASLEEELKRLGTNYIDIYLFHSTFLIPFRKLVKGPKGLMDEAKKAKRQGLIHHIGISCHDTPENIINILEMSRGAIEVIVIQYNLLDRKNESVIEYCKKKGVGVAVMGPIGGGRLISPSEIYQKVTGAKSTAEAALRFVLSNSGVSTAMSGMNSREQLEENTATVSREEPLTKEEGEQIDKIQKKNSELLNLYCTGCSYCMPCPNGVNIPGNFTALNLLKVHGLPELARKTYERLDSGKAKYCKNCSQCIGKCPQHIDIPRRLKEVKETFERRRKKLNIL